MSKQKIDYLITGGLGFIGINFIDLLSRQGETLNILVVDYLSPQSHDVKELEKYKSILNIDVLEANIRSVELRDIIVDIPIENIVHFAAESHVDRSISTPEPFIESNILGTYDLLEMVRKYQPTIRFHHVSTDEVYGSTDFGLFNESSTYNPSSVYSASKAASDMLVNSYIKTYNLKASISNCCNNYGKYQNEEKLIPKYIRYLKDGKPFPLYNNGLNIREWIHVDDHNEAVLKILKSDYYERFNIGSGDELRNIYLLRLIHDKACLHGKNVETDFEKTIDRNISDRQGHDSRYAIDSSYLRNKLKFEVRNPSIASSILDLINHYWN